MTDTQGLTSPQIEIPEAAVRFASEALGETAGEHRDAMAHAAIAAAAPLIVAAATGDATAIYARVCSAELVERLGRDGLERLVREVLAAVRKAGVDEPAKSAEPQRQAPDGDRACPCAATDLCRCAGAVPIKDCGCYRYTLEPDHWGSYPYPTAEPRTWRAGDPEPEDFPTVASPSGANEFAHREGGWFHTSGCTCCVDIPWDVLVRQCGPLTEVFATAAGV